MSNKRSKRNKKKKAKKAKVNVVSVIKTDPNRHIALLDIEHGREAPAESTWGAFVKWLKTTW